MERRPTRLLFISSCSPFCPGTKSPSHSTRRRLRTEPTASALLWRAAWIGKKPSVKGWKKKEKKSWGCARRGGRAKQPNGRMSRNAKKKPKAGHGDRGGGATTSREIPGGDGTAVEHGEAMKGVRQSRSLSLPLAHPHWRSKISNIPTETTERT